MTMNLHHPLQSKPATGMVLAFPDGADKEVALHSRQEISIMDATRNRRTRDNARRQWYASSRCRRFARLLGFRLSTPVATKKG